jgi:hypothetical protein
MEKEYVVFELPRLDDHAGPPEALYLLPPRSVPIDKVPNLVRLLILDGRHRRRPPTLEETQK